MVEGLNQALAKNGRWGFGLWSAVLYHQLTRLGARVGVRAHLRIQRFDMRREMVMKALQLRSPVAGMQRERQRG